MPDAIENSICHNHLQQRMHQKNSIYSSSLLQNLNSAVQKNFQINILKTVWKVEKQERHHSEPEHSKEMQCVSAQENLLRSHASPMLHREQTLKG